MIDRAESLFDQAMAHYLASIPSYTSDEEILAKALQVLRGVKIATNAAYDARFSRERSHNG